MKEITSKKEQMISKFLTSPLSFLKGKKLVSAY